MNIASSVFRKFVFVVLFATVVLAAADEGYKRFHGQKVYRAVATTEKQRDVLTSIEKESRDGVSFWTPAGSVNIPVDVMVSPERDAEILSVFRKADVSYETLIEDVQTLIDTENPEIGRTLRAGEVTPLNWTAYHRVDAIYAWLDELAETYPNWVEIVVIGQSYEGRQIKGIKITFNEDNPGVFIEGGLHAREWITPAVVTYMTNEILTSTDEAFNLHIRSHNWFIFPVTNPDGYEYAHTTNRMWRKNRKPQAGNCTGADPNRNWSYYWLYAGASDQPCAETYAGPEPFSEPEVKALADYLTSIRDKFYIYLSIHSYSQLFLSPFGYSTNRTNNYDDLMHIGNKAAEALARRYGTQYIVGSAAEAIYVNSGNSIDWVKGVHNISIVYCIELRDRGAYGFLLPAEQIIPSSLEYLDSLVAILVESKNLGYPVIHSSANGHELFKYSFLIIGSLIMYSLKETGTTIYLV